MLRLVINQAASTHQMNFNFVRMMLTCVSLALLAGNLAAAPIDCGNGPRIYGCGTFYATNDCTPSCINVSYPLPQVAGVGATLDYCSPPPGTCMPVGTTVVSCRGRDACGNLDWCGFEVRVLQAALPTFVFPSPIVVLTNQAGASCTPAIYELPVVNNGRLFRCGPELGACLPVGTHNVICEALSGRGACLTTASFEVRVVQGRPQPPQIQLERRDSAWTLNWETNSGVATFLQTSGNPDGPWETIPDTSPGYRVNPSEFKQYFRILIPE